MNPNAGKRIILFSVVVFIIAIGVSIYLMFFSPDQFQTQGQDLEELMNNGGLVGGIAISVSIIIVGVAMFNLFRLLNPPKIKNGIPARAEVIDVSDTGTTLNDNPQVKLLLSIHKPDGSIYEAEIKTLVSRLNAANVRPGCAAEIKYDPANPKRVELVKLDLAGQESSVGKIADRLENLTELRDKRLITEEEYKSRREEILKEL